MQKAFLYTATTLYAFSPAYAKVDDGLKLENLMQICQQAEVKVKVSESLLTLYKLQENNYSGCESFEKIKDTIKQLDVQVLEEQYAQDSFEFTFAQAVFTIRSIQDQACSGNITIEHIKEAIEQQFGGFKDIKDDNPEQAAALRYMADIFKQATALIADATRKNMLPAVDARIFKKGVDAQATRLKVITLVEEFFK